MRLTKIKILLSLLVVSFIPSFSFASTFSVQIDDSVNYTYPAYSGTLNGHSVTLPAGLYNQIIYSGQGSDFRRVAPPISRSTAGHKFNMAGVEYIGTMGLDNSTTTASGASYLGGIQVTECIVNYTTHAPSVLTGGVLISDTDPMVPTSFFTGGVNGASTTEPYLIFDYNPTDCSTPTVPPPDISTRIIDFTPEDNSTTTSSVHFSLHAYVNPDDIGTFIGIKFTLHNIDQNVLLLSAFSPSDIYLLDGFNATTSGDFYFSDTRNIGIGNYRLNATLDRSYLSGWFINPFSPINEDLSHQFIVCDSPASCGGTFIGNISQNGFKELNSIFASTSATSTASNASNCNPLGTFDIIKCSAFLFIPGGDYLDTTMKGLKDGVLTRVPWGYVTRIYNIFNTTSTTSLPSYTVTIPLGPSENTSLAFDPADMLAGAGSLLDNIHDPINNKTLRDVFQPFVQLTLAIAVLFTIISDLMGSHKHVNDETNSKRKLS